MGCFLVPASEAVVTTVVKKVLDKKYPEIEFTKKLDSLEYMLWGGSALLAFEHVWHGELQPFFPFLTAAADPADMAMLLKEMATVGVGMSVIVTLVWFASVMISYKLGKKDSKAISKEEL